MLYPVKAFGVNLTLVTFYYDLLFALFLVVGR